VLGSGREPSSPKPGKPATSRGPAVITLTTSTSTGTATPARSGSRQAKGRQAQVDWARSSRLRDLSVASPWGSRVEGHGRPPLKFAGRDQQAQADILARSRSLRAAARSRRLDGASAGQQSIDRKAG